MLEGKFRCVKSDWQDIMSVENIYEFTNGEFELNTGVVSSGYKSVEDFHDKNPNFQIELITEPKYMTNSELWMLAETKQIKDGDKFQFQEDSEFKITFYSGEGYFLDDNYNVIQFAQSDKWLPIPSKPKMTRKQVEEVYGIIVED